MQRMVALTNTPFAAGAEVAVLDDAPGFEEEHVGEVFIDDPWWGTVPLTVVAYDADDYPTFNTIDSIMFDADASHFRCGNPCWWGVLWAYVIARGAFVLTS